MALPGSLWVEADALHWRNASNTEYEFLGTSLGSPDGAAVGSLWIEGENLHYIDASGVERIVTGPTVSAQSGLAGSLWIDSAWDADLQLHWLDADQVEHYAHVDVAGEHDDSHGDTAHSDTAHTDTAHADSHNDTAHTDTHGDAAHVDIHYDVADPFSPIPTPFDDHNDFGDGAYHIDIVFHNDGGGNPFLWTESGAETSPHVDTHTDTAHTDSHGDTAHVDTAHVDTAHVDSHGDAAGSGHQDMPEAV